MLDNKALICLTVPQKSTYTCMELDVSVPERLLLLFCHEPKTESMSMVHFESGTELNTLRSLFPGFEQAISGKRVMDFGCGHGYQSVALARAGAAEVIGVEVEPTLMMQSISRARESIFGQQIKIISKAEAGTADVIISQNSFEHFIDPISVLEDLKSALAPGGVMYVTFGPLWLSPKGSHMGFFCSLPWVNLLFSEATLLSVRRRYRTDGATSYEEAGLGKMTVSRFEQVVQASGLRLVWKRYDCLKNISLFRRVPILRELFVNRISCVIAAA